LKNLGEAFEREDVDESSDATPEIWTPEARPGLSFMTRSPTMRLPMTVMKGRSHRGDRPSVLAFKLVEWSNIMNKRPPRRSILNRAPLDPVTLRVITDPLRSFVLYSLVPEAKTARRLAGEVGCPKTRLYYHLQQLEKHGLIFVERTRKVSGIIEKSYRAAARDWVLDRTGVDPGAAPGRARIDALLAFVFDQTRLEIQRQVENRALDLTRRAPDPSSLMAYRNVLKLDRTQASRLYRRLLDFWMEYEEIARNPAEEGDFYAFTVALYPNAIQNDPPLQPAPRNARKGRPQ
jgi:hypothetical protein